MNEMEHLLRQGLEEMGIPVDPGQVNHFIEFYELLMEWNTKMNLTTITEPTEVITRHFLDSASCSQSMYFAQCRHLLDLGTGAGFPGIPLKILYPDKHFTLMDSLAKRIRFLNEVKETLSLEEIKLVHGRAEEAARDPLYRETFDGVVSRAVASLPVLLEYTVPFLKKGGYLFCQKGPKWQEELHESQNAMNLLCVSMEESVSVHIPYTDLRHQLLVFRKTKETPGVYPRKAGTPAKKPL